MKPKRNRNIPLEVCPHCQGTGRRPEPHGLGLFLRSCRRVEQIGVRELASKLSISPTYVCDVEAGRRRPSSELLKRYLEALQRAG
jgi:hypothetical protein